MQKYSKTMQIKQFSLAGIPLRTVIKSSRSGIAISNHKWDPRQGEPELGPGAGLGRCEECRPGLEPAVPMLWGAQSPQEHQHSVLRGPWQGTGRRDGVHGETIWSLLSSLCPEPLVQGKHSGPRMGQRAPSQPLPSCPHPSEPPTPKLGSTGETGGAWSEQRSERGHTRGSEGAREIHNYNYNNGNSVSS